MDAKSFSEFEYISFDCYGTLIDWENGILKALNKPLDDYESIEKIQVLKSFAKWEAKVEAGPFMTYFDVLTQVFQGMKSEIGIKAAHDSLIAESLGHWLPFSDTTPALKRLNQRFKLVILSNVDEAMFAETQKKLKVEFFETFVAEKIGSYKPSRKNFEYMIEKLDCDPSEILHVAQSLFHDHVPAKAMGMTTVWVNRPSILKGQGVSMPAEVQPDFTVSNMSELVQLVVD